MGGGGLKSAISNIGPLMKTMIAVVIIMAVSPIILTQTNSASSAAVYANGDTSVEVSITGQAGVDSSTGVITCGDSTPANNFAKCGQGKWTAFVSVLNLLPLLVAASALGVAGWFGISRLRGSAGGPNSEHISGALIGGALTLVVALVLLVVANDLLVDFVVSARTNGFTNSIALIRLIPAVMLIGTLGLATIGGAFGFGGSGGRRRRMRRRAMPSIR